MRSSYSTNLNVRNTGFHRLPGKWQEKVGKADPGDPRLAQIHKQTPIPIVLLGVSDHIPSDLSAEAME